MFIGRSIANQCLKSFVCLYIFPYFKLITIFSENCNEYISKKKPGKKARLCSMFRVINVRGRKSLKQTF